MTSEYEKRVERRARAMCRRKDSASICVDHCRCVPCPYNADARATMESDREAGLALVPREATEVMLKASSQGDTHRARGYWRRMVAAGDVLQGDGK